MSDQTQEPTMEEILASIRRIISEDDAPAAEAETPALAAPEPEPVAMAPAPEPAPAAVEPPIEHADEEEVLELTERVEPAAAETHGDIDVYTPPVAAAPEPAPAPVAVVPSAPYTPPAARAPLVSSPAASAAASSFGALSAAISMPRDGRTLEDVVRELLNPLLAAWLDEHLPAIVQAKVEEEVERIARGRVR